MYRRLSAFFIVLLLLTSYSSIATVELKESIPSTDGAFLHAKDRYGNNVSLRKAAEGNFSHLLPAWELYRVAETNFTPPMVHHFMAYHRTLNESYDLSRQYNSLLTAAGIAILTAGKALDVATVFASLGNGELDSWKRVVDAQDSVWLGFNVSSPSVTISGLGWEVTLYTWSEQNGVLANWTLNVGASGLTSVNWRGNSTRVGPFSFEPESLVLRTGHWVSTNFSGTPAVVSLQRENGTNLDPAVLISEVLSLVCAPLATGTNYDNTTWVVSWVQHPTCAASAPTDLVDSGFGPRIANAGVKSYNYFIRDWGLPKHSPTGVHQVFVIYYPYGTVPGVIACYMCALPSPDNQTRLIVDWKYLEDFQAVGFYTNAEIHNATSVAESVLAHEYFHVIQWTIYQWVGLGGVALGQYNWAIEGQARFVQSSITPRVEHDDSSLFYADTTDGTNYIMADPEASPNTLDYAFALHWGYLFSKDGSYGFLNRSMHELIDAPLGGNEGANRTITDALANGTGAHNSFVEALQGFAEAVIWRNNFSWGNTVAGASWNWSAHLLAVETRTASLSGDTYSVTQLIHAFGLSYVPLPTNGTYEIKVSSNESLIPRVLYKAGDAFGTLSLTRNQTQAIDLSIYNTAYIGVVKDSLLDANYTAEYRRV